MRNKFTRQVAMVLTAVMLLLFVSPAVSAKAGTVQRTFTWNKMTTGCLSDEYEAYEYKFSIKRSGRITFLHLVLVILILLLLCMILLRDN